jgi:hypothetical protein
VNPELRRYLWLELGWHRLVVAPAALLLVFGLFGANAAEGADWREPIFPAALGLLFFIVHLWGSRLASESVVDELRDRTWDLQRLSVLSPWTMAWGKLLGGPIAAWYAGIFCFGALAVSGPAMLDARSLAWLLLALAASAVALHGTALAASLQAARKNAKSAGRFATVFLVLPLFLAMWVMPVANERALGAFVHWHGFLVERIEFLALSAAAFAAWAVFGAWRAMCRELQVRTLPWAWPAFALFLAWWVSGFASGGEFGAWRAFVAFGVAACVVLTYVALFSDVTTAMVVRRFVTRAAGGGLLRALEELPAWPGTLALGLVLALAAPLAFADYGVTLAGLRIDELQRIAVHAPLALVLLAARDCALLVFFASAPRPRRVEAATLLYLFLLSWVIPALLGAVGLGPVAKLLMPLTSVDGPEAAIIMGVQAAIVAGLAAWRWRRNYGQALRAP